MYFHHKDGLGKSDEIPSARYLKLRSRCSLRDCGVKTQLNLALLNRRPYRKADLASYTTVSDLNVAFQVRSQVLDVRISQASTFIYIYMKDVDDWNPPLAIEGPQRRS